MKPMAEYIFRNVDGYWRNISGESEILADVLHKLEIDFPDKCEFARYNDYENQRSIWIRAYGGKITITIWKQFI